MTPRRELRRAKGGNSKGGKGGKSGSKKKSTYKKVDNKYVYAYSFLVTPRDYFNEYWSGEHNQTYEVLYKYYKGNVDLNTNNTDSNKEEKEEKVIYVNPKPEGYYSKMFKKVYYDGYGYNFYYTNYGYYEYSVHPTYQFPITSIVVITITSLCWVVCLWYACCVKDPEGHPIDKVEDSDNSDSSSSSTEGDTARKEEEP